MLSFLKFELSINICYDFFFFFGLRQPGPIKSLLLVTLGWLVTPFSQKRLRGFF